MRASSCSIGLYTGSCKYPGDEGGEEELSDGVAGSEEEDQSVEAAGEARSLQAEGVCRRLDLDWSAMLGVLGQGLQAGVSTGSRPGSPTQYLGVSGRTLWDIFLKCSPRTGGGCRTKPGLREGTPEKTKGKCTLVTCILNKESDVYSY